MGETWSVPVVVGMNIRAGAEAGDRAFTAAELVGLALLLDTTVEGLLRPPLSCRAVELSPGSAVHAAYLSSTEPVDWRARDRLAHLHELAAQVIELGEHLQHAIAQAADGGPDTALRAAE
jgi:hypothetical protein